MLLKAQTKAEKFTARGGGDIQSALDTLMGKWIDPVETKHDKCKETTKM